MKNDDGKKAHPTQKPESLLYRVLLSSTRKGETVLDPFFGTGTTGAVAKKLGRDFIGLERDPYYADVAEQRIKDTAALSDESLKVKPKREQKRIPFGTLIEQGLLKPGTVLTDARQRHKARIHADGSLAAQNRIDPIRGSIHKVGAAVQGAPSCNGWTFWHYQEKGQHVPIDTLRQRMRANTAI